MRKRVAVYHSPSGWATAPSMVDYLEGQFQVISESKPCALILDIYPGHNNDIVKATTEALGIQLIWVPPGHTADLQPLDVGVNGPLKAKARRFWREHRLEKEVSHLSKPEGASLFTKALLELSKETIISSFDCLLA